MVWLNPDISQLTSRVGGKGVWDSKLPISLHYLAQGERQGGGLRSLPLVPRGWPHNFITEIP